MENERLHDLQQAHVPQVGSIFQAKAGPHHVQAIPVRVEALKAFYPSYHRHRGRRQFQLNCPKRFA
eukprot:517730-Prorocentrum_lima.AAC.1